MDHKWKLSTDLYTLMNYTGVFVKHLRSESFLTAYQKIERQAFRSNRLSQFKKNMGQTFLDM